MTLDTPSVVDIQLTSIWGMVLAAISILASFYIFTQTWKHWRKDRTLAIGRRIPFYAAIISTGLGINILVDHATAYQEGNVWSSVIGCRTVGWFYQFFICADMALMAGLAVVMYRTLCRYHSTDLGRYDWKLLLAVLSLPVITSCIQIPAYGPGVAGCFTNRGRVYALSLGHMIFCFTAVTVITGFFLVIVWEVALKGRRQWNEFAHIHSGRRQITESRILQRMIGYILIYVGTWIPLFVFQSIFKAGHATTGRYMVFLVTLVASGTLNALLYAWLENTNQMSANGSNHYSGGAGDSCATDVSTMVVVKMMDKSLESDKDYGTPTPSVEESAAMNGYFDDIPVMGRRDTDATVVAVEPIKSLPPDRRTKKARSMSPFGGPIPENESGRYPVMEPLSPLTDFVPDDGKL